MNDSNPFPGLQISPLHGVVPVGGYAELQAKLTPDSILKFDTRVQVSVKGCKNMELRMGGTVEPPLVDIDLVSILQCMGTPLCFFFHFYERKHVLTRCWLSWVM